MLAVESVGSKGLKPTELCAGNYHRNEKFNPGRMASHSFIENNRRFMVFPLRDHFTIENGLLG